MTLATGATDDRSMTVRIADHFRFEIESGVEPPGSQLPTIEETAKDWGCSTTVVRAAYDLLRQQGLVITRQGKGSFVRQRPTVRRHGMERYSRARWKGGQAVLIAEVAQQGLRADQVMRSLEDVPAPPAVAGILGISPGTLVFARMRMTLIEGRPNQLADSYYPQWVTDRVPRLRDENTGPGGGFCRIEEAGIPLTWIDEAIEEVRMPTGPEKVALRLPPGTPVVVLARTAFTGPDDALEPVEVFRAVIAGDMASFHYRFRVPD